MLKLYREQFGKNLDRPLREMVFFVLFYLYLWLVVDVRFIYHGGGEIYRFPFFNFSLPFFQQTLSRPGGLVEYIASFLSEFLYYSWTGALVITAIAWILCRAADVFFKAAGVRYFRMLRFVLPIILLILYNRYTHFLVTAFAVATALFFTCLYLKARRESQPANLIIFLILSAGLYTIAGGSYLVFAALCVIYELFFGPPFRKTLRNGNPARRPPCRRHVAAGWKTALSYLPLALMIVYVEGALVYGESVYDSFCRLTAFDTKISFFEPDKKMLWIAGVLSLALPAMALLLGIGRIFVKEKRSGDSVQKKSYPAGRKLSASGWFRWYENRPVLKWTVESLLLIVITATSLFFTVERWRKCLFAIDYYAYHKKWDSLLRVSRSYPEYFLVIHTVNKALYHTGRMASEMFAYPQHPTALFLATGEDNMVRWKRYDIYIELGYINIAEGELTESFGRLGYHPVILEKLALVNMVKGNMAAARRFLGVLSKTIFQAKWAKNYLEQLKNDPDLSENSRIQYLRSIMAEKDCVEGALKNDIGLLELLEKNRYNRAAFEYLMARYLLTGRLEKVAANLHRLNDFGFKEIPRHYEEAILIYERLGDPQTQEGAFGVPLNDVKVDLGNFQISRESKHRYRGFLEIYYRHMADRQAAYKELSRDYSDSYFFCFLYKVTGKI